ncbi:MAG: hypothetical protein JRI68_16670 [Deltaproteobacteria bacterium]|nr:hypothetical protein [Deltaproteobacteria bacterium]
MKALRWGLIRRPCVGWVLVAWLALGSGCADELEVESLAVTTRTGTTSTDQNIHFCFTRLDVFERHCINLDTDADDFELGATDRFSLVLGEPIAVDDAGGLPAVADILFDNRGGSPTDGWTMDGFQVDAVLDDGTTSPVCRESGLALHLKEGDRYLPAPCP